MDETVGVEGVAALRALEMEVEADAPGGLGDLDIHRRRLLPGHPVLGGEVLEPVTVAEAGRPGVELEAAPVDLDGLPVGEVGQGRLEPPLPDIAPGTDHVRPDLHSHDALATPGTPAGVPPAPRDLGGFRAAAGVALGAQQAVEADRRQVEPLQAP